MCGVFGFISNDKKKESEIRDSLEQAATVLSHRGPDASGIFIDSNVGLGHTRLSILDPTSAGNQPFQLSSGRFVISHNGEVYNFQDIANTLGMLDRVSGTDTEVILKGFERIGTALFSQLNGIFAFAIFDRKKRKLWLVRDRMGVKSLYYMQSKQGFFFASEVKGVFAMDVDDTSRMLNYEAVHEWTYFGSSLGEKNLFLGVKRLLPGHYLEIDVDTLDVNERCYWSIQQTIEAQLKSKNLVQKNVLINETRKVLEGAVKRQLVSDVPVGVFLSGGIDSSAITAFASKHYYGKLATYSVAFDFDRPSSELPMAKRVAKHFQTEHHEIYINGVDIADVVEKMVHHNDAPFSDAANIPLYLLCHQIKDKTKVVLQGDGGDELFAGYQRYTTLSHLKAMRMFARMGKILNAFTAKNTGFYSRRRYINALLPPDDATLMALLLTVEDKTESPLSIFSDVYQAQFEKYDPFGRYREVDQVFQKQSIVNRMFLVDKTIILPDVFLEKVDKASMAASVEVRVPFLDNEVVELCLGLDASQKIVQGKKKWLLKKALEGVIPQEVLHGKKRGFGVPYGYWIKGALSTLLQDHLALFYRLNPNVLNKIYIDGLVADHKENRRNYGFLLWKLLNFVIWSNQNKMVITHE